MNTPTARIPFLLGKGCIQSREVMHFYGSTVAANERDEWSSVLLRWSAGTWECLLVETRLCGVCVTDEGDSSVAIAVGIDGSYALSSTAGVHSGHVDPSENGPSNLRHITAIRASGTAAYAVGMGRMVYKRDAGTGSWRAIDVGVSLPAGSGQVAGFKAVDGDGADRLIAVGLSGEIWLCEDTHWRRLESPTNVKLESVRWIGDHVYIGGAAGTVLYGDPGHLQVLEAPGVNETFWSVEWFQDRLFLATGKGSIYALDEARLQKIKLPSGRPATTGSLHTADGLLLSVGSRDALVFDGERWEALSPPTGESEPPLDWLVR